MCIHTIIDSSDTGLCCSNLACKHFVGLPSGIRHFAMLKLIGVGHKASGTVELFPLNGESLSSRERPVHGTVIDTGTWDFMPICAIIINI